MRNRRVLCAGLTGLLAVCIALAAAVWVCVGIAQEGYQVAQETLDVPAPAFPLQVQAADAALRDLFPQACGDKALTAAATLHIRNGAVAEGRMCLTYYRDVDDWMEGGTVETQDYTIDVAAEKVVSGRRFYGSGKACTAASDPVAAAVMEVPIEWYAAHCEELVSPTGGADLYLICRATAWGMDVYFRENSESGAILYAERLTGWDLNGGFAGRQYEKLHLPTANDKR